MENGGTMTEDVSFLASVESSDSDEFRDSDEFEANVSAMENQLLGNVSHPFDDTETSSDEVKNNQEILEGL